MDCDVLSLPRGRDRAAMRCCWMAEEVKCESLLALAVTNEVS